MRVGILTYFHESNTFIDGVTIRRHFEEDRLLRDQAVRTHFEDTEHELGGFFQGLLEAGIEAVPLFVARAYPFGVIEAETFDGLLEELLESLRSAGPLDGVLAAASGAMVAENHADADGCWLGRVREALGPAVPLIATLDLHANVSLEMVTATTALIAFRTNPHLDQRETGLRAARLMTRVLRGEVRPTQAAAFPPLTINVRCQATAESPLKELYEWARMLEAESKVLSQSLMLGFPYADVLEMGCAAVVVTDDDPALAQRLAGALSEDLWARRVDFAPGFTSPRQAVDSLAQYQDRVLLLDMGDNIGAGAPGHGTILLEELQRRGVPSVFVCLHDPETVHKADAAGAGATLDLCLGGLNDGLHGNSVQAECRVLSLHDGKFRDAGPSPCGIRDFDQVRTAVVRTTRDVTVMVTSRRVPAFSLEQLRSFGLDPASFRIIVAKGVTAPLAVYGPLVDRVIHVNTPGVTCADLTHLPFHHRRKPMFPFEPDVLWPPLPREGIPLRGDAGDDTSPVPIPSNPSPLCSAQ